MKKIFKRLFIGLSGLIGLLLIAGFMFYQIGKSRLGATIEVPDAVLISKVSADSATVARGAHLSQIFMCTECHGPQLEGALFLDIPPFRAVAANLTPAGLGATYTVSDFDRSIRFGVGKSGKKLVTMPSEIFNRMSKADASDLLAYIQQLKPISSDLPTSEYRAPLYLMAGMPGSTMVAPFPTSDMQKLAPPVGATAEYGAYLSAITCTICHGDDLRGAPHPSGELDSPDLTAAAGWPLEAFKKALRTGMGPTNMPLRKEYMPWPSFQHMTDQEIEAIHLHLHALLQ